MDIKSVSGTINAYTRPISNNNPQDTNTAIQAKNNVVTDKLEISKEARELQSKDITAKDYTKIQNRIDSGYYNSKDVIAKVAESILQSF